MSGQSCQRQGGELQQRRASHRVIPHRESGWIIGGGNLRGLCQEYHYGGTFADCVLGGAGTYLNICSCSRTNASPRLPTGKACLLNPFAKISSVNCVQSCYNPAATASISRGDRKRGRQPARHSAKKIMCRRRRRRRRRFGGSQGRLPGGICIFSLSSSHSLSLSLSLSRFIRQSPLIL